jgi:hypothetical protein
VTDRQLAGLAVAVAALVPQAVLARTPTVCLFRRATGRPCPSCGLTRSWNATTRLQMRRAFAIHPFGPPTLAVAALFALAPPGALARPELRSQRFLAAVGAAWIATWFVRLVRAGR